MTRNQNRFSGNIVFAWHRLSDICHICHICHRKFVLVSDIFFKLFDAENDKMNNIVITQVSNYTIKFKTLGYSDMGAYWRSAYESDETFEKDVEELMNQV